MTTLYSIGYGNRQWDDVCKLLKNRGCEYLIDVRSSPYSKFNPSFNKDLLATQCAKEGIKYVFMGDVLGGRPAAPDHFDSEGKVDYVRLAEGAEFKSGLARLITAHSKGICVSLMCSELKPHECHRCKLIGVELKKAGIETVHIDETGLDISQDEAIKRLNGGQEDIFGSDPVTTRSRGRYKR